MDPILACTQIWSTNEWAGWQNGVNDDVCAQAPWVCMARAMIDEKLRHTEWQVVKNIINKYFNVR